MGRLSAGGAHGAHLGQDDDRRWVSAPLWVHRRCESPMFEISNRVAYDGMMISATVPSEGWHSPGAQVCRSLWRNTEFSNPDSKVQESDFQVFADLMTEGACESHRPGRVASSGSGS